MVGLDACRENLVKASQDTTKHNSHKFVIANALTLPGERSNLVKRVTINFPWGSLLEGMLCENTSLFTGLISVLVPGAIIDIRLNSSALQPNGFRLDEGAAQIYHVLNLWGFSIQPPIRLG